MFPYGVFYYLTELLDLVIGSLEPTIPYFLCAH